MHVCEDCFHGAKEIGEVTPGYWLVFWKDKYWIIAGSGHYGHELFQFEHKPEEEPEDDSWGEWFSKASCSSIKLHPNDGYLFVESCKQASYNIAEDGDIMPWFFNRCGKLIQETNFDEKI